MVQEQAVERGAKNILLYVIDDIYTSKIKHCVAKYHRLIYAELIAHLRNTYNNLYAIGIGQILEEIPTYYKFNAGFNFFRK